MRDNGGSGHRNSGTLKYPGDHARTMAKKAGKTATKEAKVRTKAKPTKEPRLRNVYVGGPWNDKATAEATGEGIAATLKGAVVKVSKWGKAKVRWYVTVKAPQEAE